MSLKNKLRSVYYALPTQWRFRVRRWVYWPLDVFEYLTDRRRPPYPPRGLIFTGAGDFKAQGEKLLQEFIDYGQLKPADKVLDIGSGMGRLAIPMTKYLNSQGSYDGFDVVKLGIDWCTKHIYSEYPNFKFTYVPLYNDLYTGHTQKAEDFRFPYPDNHFDKVVLLSVFTHLLPQETAHYIAEIGRVLKAGGLCYATFFVMNDESKQMMHQGFSFPHEYENYYLMSKQVKAANVAYKEAFLFQELIESNALKVLDFLPGWWCGRQEEDCVQFQDVVIFGKPK